MQHYKRQIKITIIDSAYDSRRYNQIKTYIQTYIRKLLIKETKHSKEKIERTRIFFKPLQMSKQLNSWECGYKCIDIFIQLMLNEWDYNCIDFDNSKESQKHLVPDIWPYFKKYTLDKC